MVTRRILEMRISSAEFLERPLNALSFYDILPTDGVEVVASASMRSINEIIIALTSIDEDVSEIFLNEALLALLGAPPLDADLAADAAAHVSLLYARFLIGGKRDRSRRMKLQQLNFFLRDLLDRDAPSLAETLRVPGEAPWDWLATDFGEITILSGADGLRWTMNGLGGTAEVGFPSQLDQIDSERVSVGSIFTPGGTIFQNGLVTRVEHQSPIVLIFNLSGEDWAVAYDGTVLKLADDVAVLNLDVRQVDRVRLIDGKLFVSDWTTPGAVIVCDLASQHQKRVSLNPIILLNDICKVGSRYYAICKQQGRVFAFDSALNFIEQQLKFGRGAGRLFDPITVRHHQGRLHVLNWVTATRVILKPF